MADDNSGNPKSDRQAPMGRQLDLFTQRRLEKFVSTFRGQKGELPTFKDLTGHGFDSDIIKLAVKRKLIEEFYVTLTNGTIVKGYKISGF